MITTVQMPATPPSPALAAPAGPTTGAEAAPPPPGTTGAETPSGEEASPEPHRFGFTAAMGGVYVPVDTNPAAFEAEAGFVFRYRIGDARVTPTFAYVTDKKTSSVHGLLVARSYFYLGNVYGLGAGVMVGAASYSKKVEGAADGGTGSFGAFAVPMLLRFGAGSRLDIEVAAQLGVISFTSGDVKTQPWGAITLGIATK
jgi:hypothetical protein